MVNTCPESGIPAGGGRHPRLAPRRTLWPDGSRTVRPDEAPAVPLARAWHCQQKGVLVPEGVSTNDC